MAAYTATQAAKALGVSQEFLRMKMRQGCYSDIGEAIPPSKGHEHWRFPCYPARVAQRTGRPVKHNGIKYYPDGRVEEE